MEQFTKQKHPKNVPCGTILRVLSQGDQNFVVFDHSMLPSGVCLSAEGYIQGLSLFGDADYIFVVCVGFVFYGGCINAVFFHH